MHILPVIDKVTRLIVDGAGKSIMPSLVEVNELKPLLDAIGPAGVNILVNFKSEKDIEAALEIVSHFL